MGGVNGNLIMSAYMVDMYVSVVREGRDVGRGIIHYLCVGFGCGFCYKCSNF